MPHPFLSRRLFSRLALLLVLVLVPALSGCAISEEQEVKMGLDAAPEFEKQFGGLYPDEQVQAYVRRVGEDLVRYTDRQDLPWEFSVLNAKDVNAFALPGGQIYITQGLLSKLENEAQLAAILGHEIGHVQHRHSAQQIERAQLAQGGTLLASVLGSAAGVGGVGDVAQLASGLALMRYGRDQEREADTTGLEYMARAGYDPEAIVETMRILQEEGGGGGGPDFLSTHPDPGSRAEDLQERIEKENLPRQGRTGREEFERNVLDRLRDGGRDRGRTSGDRDSGRRGAGRSVDRGADRSGADRSIDSDEVIGRRAD